MRRLVDLLVKFKAAVRKFGKKGWLQRAFKMQSHVKSLGRLDKRIVAQLQTFRDIYRLSVDHLMMERTYRIEAAVGQLVAERVRAPGVADVVDEIVPKSTKHHRAHGGRAVGRANRRHLHEPTRRVRAVALERRRHRRAPGWEGRRHLNDE